MHLEDLSTGDPSTVVDCSPHLCVYDDPLISQHWLNLRQLLLCSRLQVRDITTSPEWERAYGLVIPVLTCADADGSNEVRTGMLLLDCHMFGARPALMFQYAQVKVPRQSPRMSTERLGAVLEQVLAREVG